MYTILLTLDIIVFFAGFISALLVSILMAWLIKDNYAKRLKKAAGKIPELPIIERKQLEVHTIRLVGHFNDNQFILAKKEKIAREVGMQLLEKRLIDFEFDWAKEAHSAGSHKWEAKVKVVQPHSP